MHKGSKDWTTYQLTRWVAASDGCTGTPFLFSFPLVPQKLGRDREHDMYWHIYIHVYFTFYKRAVDQEKEFILLPINKCSSTISHHYTW